MSAGVWGEECSDGVGIFYRLGCDRNEEVEDVGGIIELLEARSHQQGDQDWKEDEGSW